MAYLLASLLQPSPGVVFALVKQVLAFLPCTQRGKSSSKQLQKARFS